MSVPGQFNYYDLLLGLSPPIVTCAACIPAAESAFGWLTKFRSSYLYTQIVDGSSAYAVAIILVSVVLLYAAGQLLHTLTDTIRYTLLFRVARLHCDMAHWYHQSPLKPAFDRRMPDTLGSGWEEIPVSDRIWVAYRHVEQNGNSLNLDRFNALSIYMVALSMSFAIATAFQLVSLLVAGCSLGGFAMLLSCAFLCLACVYRSSQFRSYFVRATITAYVAR